MQRVLKHFRRDKGQMSQPISRSESRESEEAVGYDEANQPDHPAAVAAVLVGGAGPNTNSVKNDKGDASDNSSTEASQAKGTRPRATESEMVKTNPDADPELSTDKLVAESTNNARVMKTPVPRIKSVAPTSEPTKRVRKRPTPPAETNVSQEVRSGGHPPTLFLSNRTVAPSEKKPNRAFAIISSVPTKEEGAESKPELVATPCPYLHGRFPGEVNEAAAATAFGNLFEVSGFRIPGTSGSPISNIFQRSYHGAGAQQSMPHMEEHQLEKMATVPPKQGVEDAGNHYGFGKARSATTAAAANSPPLSPPKKVPGAFDIPAASSSSSSSEQHSAPPCYNQDQLYLSFDYEEPLYDLGYFRIPDNMMRQYPQLKDTNTNGMVPTLVMAALGAGHFVQGCFKLIVSEAEAVQLLLRDLEEPTSVWREELQRQTKEGHAGDNSIIDGKFRIPEAMLDHYPALRRKFPDGGLVSNDVLVSLGVGYVDAESGFVPTVSMTLALAILLRTYDTTLQDWTSHVLSRQVGLEESPSDDVDKQRDWDYLNDLGSFKIPDAVLRENALLNVFCPKGQIPNRIMIALGAGFCADGQFKLNDGSSEPQAVELLVQHFLDCTSELEKEGAMNISVTIQATERIEKWTGMDIKAWLEKVIQMDSTGTKEDMTKAFHGIKSALQDHANGLFAMGQNIKILRLAERKHKLQLETLKENPSSEQLSAHSLLKKKADLEQKLSEIEEEIKNIYDSFAKWKRQYEKNVVQPTLKLIKAERRLATLEKELKASKQKSDGQAETMRYLAKGAEEAGRAKQVAIQERDDKARKLNTANKKLHEQERDSARKIKKLEEEMHEAQKGLANEDATKELSVAKAELNTIKAASRQQKEGHAREVARMQAEAKHRDDRIANQQVTIEKLKGEKARDHALKADQPMYDTGVDENKLDLVYEISKMQEKLDVAEKLHQEDMENMKKLEEAAKRAQNASIQKVDLSSRVQHERRLVNSRKLELQEATSAVDAVNSDLDGVDIDIAGVKLELKRAEAESAQLEQGIAQALLVEDGEAADEGLDDGMAPSEVASSEVSYAATVSSRSVPRAERAFTHLLRQHGQKTEGAFPGLPHSMSAPFMGHSPAVRSAKPFPGGEYPNTAGANQRRPILSLSRNVGIPKSTGDVHKDNRQKLEKQQDGSFDRLHGRSNNVEHRGQHAQYGRPAREHEAMCKEAKKRYNAEWPAL